MPFPKPTKSEWIVLGLIVAALGTLVISPTDMVWDGHMPLTILIHEQNPVARDSLKFAVFWREAQAQEAVQNPGRYDDSFDRAEFIDEGHVLVSVLTSGRTRAWCLGLYTTKTYNHPEFLVVEYRLAADDDQTLKRKRFQIPKGRGPRSMTIVLP